jgi:uncharacterized protein
MTRHDILAGLARTGRPISREEVIGKTGELVRSKLDEESTGHDWWHVERVRATALRIAEHERADVFVVELAALLHDVEDYKFSGSAEAGPRFAHEHLSSLGVSGDIADHVSDIIRRMSFKGANVEQLPLSLEGRCLQDADRLDAIGAIGIARTFAYGGHVGRPIHDPELAPTPHDTVDSYLNSKGTTINHFHEKLLLLRERMNTEFGRKLADERHRYMVAFLDEFHSEWQGQA